MTRLRIRRQLLRFKLRALAANRACAGLRLEELERLAALVELGGASAGTVLVAEGEPQEELLLISRGAVEMSRRGCRVGFLREGDFFGFRRPGAGGASPVTLTAATAVTVLVASGDRYAAAVEIAGRAGEAGPAVAGPRAERATA